MSERTKRDCQCPRAKHVHGTRAAYQHDGCRCLHCRVAEAKAKSDWRRGLPFHEFRVSPAGMQRRLRALYANGWTWEMLGERLGLQKQNVYDLAVKPRKFALRPTAERIAALYDELWDVQPDGYGPNRARLKAARRGWARPMAWDDNIDDPAAVPVGMEGVCSVAGCAGAVKSRGLCNAHYHRQRRIAA